MKTITMAFALALAPAAELVAQGQQDDFAAVLPNGTMLYVYVDNVQSALDLDPDGDMMRLLEHDAMQEAFSGLYDQFDGLKDKDFLLALDLDERELLGLFSGRVGLAIPELALVESEIETQDAGATAHVELDVPQGGVLMADFNGTQDKFEELLTNIAILAGEEEDVHRAELVVEEFEGTRLYAIETEDLDGETDAPSWMAMVDGVFMVANEEETARSFVDLVRNGAPEGDRLLDDERYVDACDRMGETDARIYVNLGEFLPMVNTLIRQEMKQLGDRVEQFVTAENLIEGLRLDAFESAFLGAAFEDDQASIVMGMTHAETDRGLSTMFAYADGGVEIPSYFSPEFHSGSITTLDLSQLYQNFDSMLKKISPYAHTMMHMQISSMESEYGFALREAVLDNFDALLVEFIGYPEATVAGDDDNPTQAYVIRVKDPQGLSESLAEFADFMAEEDPTEFMNELVYTIPLPMEMSAGGDQDPFLAYAVVENNLVISVGEKRMVENVIAHIKNPGDSVLENSSVMDALDDLPSDDQVGLGFADVADVLANAIRGGDMGLLFEAQKGIRSACPTSWRRARR